MISEETGEKTLDLIAENRVILTTTTSQNRYPSSSEAIVAGHNAHYHIRARQQGIECDCPSRAQYCSHILAAMIAWAER